MVPRITLVILLVCHVMKQHSVFQRAQVQATEHVDRPEQFLPPRSHPRCYLPETRVWGPGPTEIPSRCSRCALGVAGAPVRGAWSCACWLSGEERAPAKRRKIISWGVPEPYGGITSHMFFLTICPTWQWSTRILKVNNLSLILKDSYKMSRKSVLCGYAETELSFSAGGNKQRTTWVSQQFGWQFVPGCSNSLGGKN